MLKKKDNKKRAIIVVITNIITLIIKFYIIIAYFLGAFLGDWLDPPTTLEKLGFVSTGILIAIAIDIIINYIIVKVFSKKIKGLEYKKLLLISIVITILETVFISLL